MAGTDAGAQLTRQHRSNQLAVRAGMLRDLLDLWETVDPFDLSGTIGRFASAGAALVRAKNRESAMIGSRYYRQFRIAEGIGAVQMPDIVDAPPVEVTRNTLRGAALKGIIDARRRGFAPRSALRRGFTGASGSATSLTLDGGRNTVIAGIGEDREALGWIRVTSGDPCYFCAAIASGVGLFNTEATADFQPHDHCACTPEPKYSGSELPELNRQFREQYDRSQREVSVSGTSNDRLNAFRRLYEGRA